MTDKSEWPIAVFDSGLGGISVLNAITTLMPQENYIYYGDSENAPYGTRSVEEVVELTLASAKFLMEKNIKALVVACNTATTAAIDVLRDTYPNMPVIGIEPALKPAVLAKPHSRILVMATPITIQEQKFQQMMEGYRNEADIIPLACPGLAEFVEKGVFEGEVIDRYMNQFIGPYMDKKIDSIVLGCTHYPFVRDAILKVTGKDVVVFDGAYGTARQLQRQLSEQGLLSVEKSSRMEVLNSSKDPHFIACSHQLISSGRA